MLGRHPFFDLYEDFAPFYKPLNLVTLSESEESCKRIPPLRYRSGWPF